MILFSLSKMNQLRNFTSRGDISEIPQMNKPPSQRKRQSQAVVYVIRVYGHRLNYLKKLLCAPEDRDGARGKERIQQQRTGANKPSWLAASQIQRTSYSCRSVSKASSRTALSSKTPRMEPES
jgi:hypothetical protein